VNKVVVAVYITAASVFVTDAVENFYVNFRRELN